MKTMKWMLGLALAGTPAVQADDLVLSLETSGKLTFNEVTNATRYRVEWASTADGSWTSFTGAAGQWLDNIPAAGSGTVTASVPMWYRVVATVNTTTTPSGMVLIPAEGFVMGNATNVLPASEGGSDELPQHTVNVSAFYMDCYEVTKALWDEVKTWADTNGYAFENVGSGKATNHPVQTINWYDMVKWCNARSQKAGLTPCYTTNGVTYKTGNDSNVVCNWSANGYRLPTEAEWEKAARGGATNTRFPWADYTNKISHAKANYYGNKSSFSYDLSNGYHPTYNDGVEPYSSPVGSFAPNGYGLYDMAGNVWEWCWDWYSSCYYSSSPGTDPTGVASGSYRAVRGGGWYDYPDDTRVAYRYATVPVNKFNDVGCRCVRRP
jgi:formylglycine-generating enzyme